MRRPTLARALTVLGALGLSTGAVIAAAPAQAAKVCVAPPQPMIFDEPGYVDETRAGGEPIIFTHPNGRLLYGSHAGTTHYYTPGSASPNVTAFGQNYRGQTYYWYSDDEGESWTFADRTLAPDNAAGSGFSDPEFAYDKSGNVYVSEINLANVAVSKSEDAGETYKLQNFFANTITDRQWTEGDEDGVFYLLANALGGGTFPGNPAGNSGHYMYKTVDGGATFTDGFIVPGGLGDIRVDKSDGRLYEAHYTGNELTMNIWPDARNQDFATAVEPEVYTIYEGVNMLAHWPAFDLDPSGNLYITWDESGTGDLAAGIYYSYSKDRGKTWAAPTRVDNDPETDIWPWLAVGDDGRVAIAWFHASEELPDHDAQTAGSHTWTVAAAQSLNGLGCAESPTPGFKLSTAVGEAIHTGTICQAGTTCQAALVDRRLGDYFSIEISGEGNLVLAYSDTRAGGPVSLPGFTRQIDGPSFFAPKGTVKPPVNPKPKPPVQLPPPAQPKPNPPAALPATGGSLAGAGLAALLAAAVLARGRARREARA